MKIDTVAIIGILGLAAGAFFLLKKQGPAIGNTAGGGGQPNTGTAKAPAITFPGISINAGTYAADNSIPNLINSIGGVAKMASGWFGGGGSSSGTTATPAAPTTGLGGSGGASYWDNMSFTI